MKKRYLLFLLALVLICCTAVAGAELAKPTIVAPEGDIYLNEDTEWTVLAPGATMVYLRFKWYNEEVEHYLDDTNWVDAGGTFHDGVPGKFPLHQPQAFPYTGTVQVAAAASYTELEWNSENIDLFVWSEETTLTVTVKSRDGVEVTPTPPPTPIPSEYIVNIPLYTINSESHGLQMLQQLGAIELSGSGPYSPADVKKKPDNMNIWFYDYQIVEMEMSVGIARGWIIAPAYVSSKMTNFGWSVLAQESDATAIDDEERMVLYGNGSATLKDFYSAFGITPPTVFDSTPTVDGLRYRISGANATVTGAESKNATKVTIPATIKANGETYKVTAIKASAFKGRKKLKTVSIGKNVKTIGKNAFASCVKLKTVTGGAALTSIGEGAFKSCKVLTAITLNKNVKTIGKAAFQSCAKLKTITIKTTKLTT